MAIRPEKPTFPPLFKSGFWDIEESQIESVFVGDINTPRRRMLASQLRLFLSELRRLGAQGDLWINGSFSTKNPNPADIDLVLCVPAVTLSVMTDENLQTLQYYASNEGRPYVRSKWGCDFYAMDSSNLGERSYYQEWFSNNPDSQNTKGIPVVKI